MSLLRPLQFIVLLLLCFLGMETVHELGHVVAARMSGGRVVLVDLHPLHLSRTVVEPNPQPGLVAWAGPILGALLPVVLWILTLRCTASTQRFSAFFAGFCLIANGAYIGVGSFEGLGDAGEMLRTGSSMEALIGFGTVTTTAGLWTWHRLGSPSRWIDFARPAHLVASLGFLACVQLLIGLIIR